MQPHLSPGCVQSYLDVFCQAMKALAAAAGFTAAGRQTNRQANKQAVWYLRISALVHHIVTGRNRGILAAKRQRKTYEVADSICYVIAGVYCG
jgi:hypothetical protein